MKKILAFLEKVLVTIVLIVTVCMMIFTVISVTYFDKNERSLFGYKAYIVTSDSMYKTDFNAGDLILVKEVNPAIIQVGDIITYLSHNPESYGETITHKVRRLTTDANGNPGFVTYGTTTDTDDATVVTYADVLGKYEMSIPRLGTFFNKVKTAEGFFVYICIPFILLILVQGLNCIRLFRRYKREQLEELEKEKAKIEAERVESLKLMRDMLELMTRLEEQKQGGYRDEQKDNETDTYF